MANVTITAPPNFGFKRTVLSHGWCELPPFHLDRSNWALTRVIRLEDGLAATVQITAGDSSIKVSTAAKLSRAARVRVERDVKHMLRLDEPLDHFYSVVSLVPSLAWVAKEGAGRLLRSPTVFEDLVKMMCTTNCSWALTEKMVNGMVNCLGAESHDGRRTFHTPAELGSMPISFFKKELSSGYRAPYLKELAENVAAGKLNVEGWLESELPSQELKKEMKRIKGVGDYVAENMLKLVGRYHGLALDSWIRSKFAAAHNKGRPASDKKIDRHYARFGDFRGLALWCDLTRDWIEEPDSD